MKNTSTLLKKYQRKNTSFTQLILRGQCRIPLSRKRDKSKTLKPIIIGHILKVP
ncbi:hypothetical protein DDD_3402 [Nonlabens dokdonensis DSW-6]|uniref:Uncharacterized protein n=1 Tax=Nonlabens dokdonensis (strain DSM 17205 / KCTC 12402 / DSW-6) TaxID=592029 RepID=L7WEG9_NONDD|nr:hypothetical protein DDD_3402 [Nonlabens dokdonensis DSW-6]